MHLQMIDQVSLPDISDPAEVAGVRTVALVSHHVVHERRLLAEAAGAEVARPGTHGCVLVLGREEGWLLLW